MYPKSNKHNNSNNSNNSHFNENQICKELMNDFPSIKLSYGTTIHKKVFNANIIMAIPTGNKYYAWFTTYQHHNVCLLIELSNNSQIFNTTICPASFTDKLSYGTVLYGTLFHFNQQRCFSVEDMFYYKGTNIESYSYLQKLTTMKQMFANELPMNSALTPQSVLFGLPLMDIHFKNVLTTIPTLPYKSKVIQFKLFKTNQTFNMNYIKPRTEYLEKSILGSSSFLSNSSSAVFKVMADIKTDIYQLFTLDNGEYTFYDIACVPSYTTSVMLNKLFRNIKENNNLDALEESDDEIEFENNNEDRFVYLDKSYLMKCEYNNKFKKWIPIQVVVNIPVVSSFQLKNK